MGMLILSETIEDRKTLLKDVLIASVLSGTSFSIDEYESKKLNSNEIVDVVVKKEYNKEQEYLILGFDSKEEVLSFGKVSDIYHEDIKYLRLAVSEDANYDHLIYDFALAYLRLRPDHCISVYGDTFFFLEDMEKLESEGGYYKDWCYKSSS